MVDNNKLFRIISISLLSLSAIASIYFFMTDFDDPEALSSSTGIFIMLCYIFLGIGAFVTLAFQVMNMLQNLKKAKNALIGGAILVLICVVGYFMAGSEIYSDIDGNLLADAATSQKSEAGLIAFYILGAVAIGAIIFSEISKMFK